MEYTLPIGTLEISVSTAKCVALGLVSAIGIFSTGKVLLGTPLMKRFYPKDEKAGPIMPGRMRVPAPASR